MKFINSLFLIGGFLTSFSIYGQNTNNGTVTKEDVVKSIKKHPRTQNKEGYFEKKDYPDKIMRYRKKWTEKELLETIRRSGFQIVDKIYNTEKDRNKEWISLYLKLP